MTAVAKLLSCPFCGRSNLIISRMHGTGDRYVVCQTPECKTCGPSGDAREDAIAAWNRRAALSPAELGGVALTTSFVQEVPDKCDRIVWRGHYYHLPVNSEPTPRAAEAVTDEMVGRALSSYYRNWSTWKQAVELGGDLSGAMRAALTAALTRE